MYLGYICPVQVLYTYIYRYYVYVYSLSLAVIMQDIIYLYYFGHVTRCYPISVSACYIRTAIDVGKAQIQGKTHLYIHIYTYI